MSATRSSHRKRILIPIWSQTGQLTRIAQAIAAPLQATCDIVWMPFQCEQEYPFPWPFFRFFDAFPESALGVAPRLQPLTLAAQADFDLIILPWQVWYLAPSLPMQGLLADVRFQALVRGKPVVSVIGCRNMWHMAYERVQAKLKSMDVRLLDNVVLTDQGSTLATFVTVPRWLLTGRSNAFWGLPAAGVGEQQVAQCARFGHALSKALEADQERGVQPLLSGLAAATAEPRLLAGERAATRSFAVWGRLVRLAGPPGAKLRIPVLALYAAFLIVAIICVMPLSLLIQALLRPMMTARILRAKERFEQPSGSSTERLSLY